MKFILVGIYLVLTLSGLIFMKLGGNSGTISLNQGTIGFSINWISLIGFICYICSFLLFTRIVIMFDLSYIMPICTGIVQIATLIASKLVFKETIGMQGIIGASIVIIGIIIMNLPKNITT
jgi:multidrug transporter EmrE-like cation transporter